MLNKVLVALIGIPIGYILYLSRSSPIRENLNYVGLPQKEITSAGDLLYSDGHLKEAGWSKKALKKFNPDTLSSFMQRFRLKKWDYFSVHHENFYFGIALADIGFAQNVQITFFELDNQTFIHRDQILIPFVHNRLNLTDEPYLISESTEQSLDAGSLKFTLTSQRIDNKEHRFLNLSLLQHNGHNLSVQLRIDSNTEDDRMVLYQPINSRKTQFFYNVKSYNWLPKGFVRFDDKEYEVLQSTSNAGSDWGRGIWNFHTFWLWAQGMGFTTKGLRFGINLGGGFQDDKQAKATEESIFVNKKLIKLKDLTYTYDLENLQEPFVIKSHNVTRQNFNLRFSWEEENQVISQEHDFIPGTFYCEFLPVHRNYKKTDLILIQMKFEQMLGIFSGAYVTQNNEIIEFHDILGIIEFNKAKW